MRSLELGNSPNYSVLSAQRPRRSVPREVWWIFLVGTILRVTFFFLGENNGGDALARAAMTAEWLQHPGSWLHSEPWLPIHFWLMAGMSVMLGDPALGARALSLLLGIASLGILWALAREVYGRSAATFSLLVFGLYSLHIGYSTTSSSEVPYLFFMLAGLLGFFIYRRSGSFSALGLGAAALGISAGIRYEAWLCIFAVFLILLFMPSQDVGERFWRVGHFQEVFLFGAVAGIWPSFWMIYQWKTFAMPLYGVTMNYGWVAEQIAIENRSMLYRLALSPGVILFSLSLPIVAASFYGLALGLRDRPGREFVLILLLMGAVFNYQIVTGGLLPLARYTITLGTFFAIASGHGLERIRRLLSQRRARQFWAAIGVLLVLNLGAILALSEVRNPFNDKFGAISPRLRFPQRIEELHQYLKRRLEPGDAVVIDDYNVESNIIAAAIGLPLLGDRAFLAASRPVSELSEYMKRRHPRYLVYSDRGVLHTSLPLAEKCSESPTNLKGMKFRCLFENDIYRVYDVNYGPPKDASDKHGPPD